MVAMAQVPPRPGDLRFAPRTFALPDAERMRHTLKNGMPVYVDEDHSLPLVQIHLAVDAGDFLDAPERIGLAGLAGALLRRGGAGSWDADTFDARADALAADIDSLGGTTRSGASLDCGSRVLAEALPLFAAMVRAPRFDAARLAQLAGNLRESFGRREDDPLDVLDREWGWLLFGGDHVGVREMRPAHLGAVSRDDLVAFHRAHWRPGRMVIAVSGDVKATEIVRTLDGLLGDWKDAGAAASPAAAPLAPAPAAGLYVRDWPGPQAKVMLGHRGPVRQGWDDPDEAALQVLAEVLGGDGAVSRLRRRLRAEEGLAYRANARLTLGLKSPGTVQLFLETDARRAARALALARGELLRLRDEPVPEVELELAKRSLLDLEPLLFDSAERRAGRFAEDELLGRPHAYWARRRERFAAVTARDVQRVAQRHLRPQELVAVVVGDRAALLAGAAADGVALERLFGPLNALPRRDPATLEAHR